MGVLFALVTAALLALSKPVEVLSGVTQVVMIIAGMTAMGALTAFQRFIESDGGPRLGPTTFNETVLSRSVSEGLPTYGSAASKKPGGRRFTCPLGT